MAHKVCEKEGVCSSDIFIYSNLQANIHDNSFYILTGSNSTYIVTSNLDN